MAAWASLLLRHQRRQCVAFCFRIEPTRFGTRLRGLEWVYHDIQLLQNKRKNERSPNGSLGTEDGPSEACRFRAPSSLSHSQLIKAINIYQY